MTEQEILEQLERAGVPISLRHASERPLDDPKLQEKYKAGTELMKIKNVVLVYGPETPTKELLCTKLMRNYIATAGKTGTWLTPIHFPRSQKADPPTGAGVVVILGVDLFRVEQLRMLKQLIRDWLVRGRKFILSVSNLEATQQLLGSDCMEYIAPQAVSIDIPSEPVKILEV